MTERIPTDAEAAWLHNQSETRGLSYAEAMAMGSCFRSGWTKSDLEGDWFLTPAGRAALARYDAEKEHQA